MPLTMADIGKENIIKKIGGNPETKKFTLDSGADFTKLDDIFKRENRYRSNQELLDKNKQDIIDNYNYLKELS